MDIDDGRALSAARARVADGRPPASAVPVGVQIAAAWAWRVLLVAAAVVAVGFVLVRVSLLTAAVVAALLLAAGLQPLAGRLVQAGVPKLAAAWLVLLGFLGMLAGTGWFVGQAVAGELDDLQASVASGVDRVRGWLVEDPVPVGNRELDQAADNVIGWLTDNNDTVTQGVVGAATVATHTVTGVLLTLFVLFFFLADGRTVWGWLVRLLPVRARSAADGAGRVAWDTLSGYIRGIVIVALVDALLIAIVLVVVGVPLVVPLAALTFLGAFVPVIGATIAGSAAVLVALVDQGLTAALIVGAAVLLIQWADSDILQPIVVGRAVSVHPLAIGLAVTAGSLLAGIGGAVVAVPLVAATNAAISHLNQRSSSGQAAPEPAGAPPRAAS